MQASLIVARLWSCSSEQMAVDDVNQYLGWTIAQLSRSVKHSHPIDLMLYTMHVPCSIMVESTESTVVVVT